MKKPTLCKDCVFCVIVELDAVDQTGNKTGAKIQNGYCHLNPPVMIGPAQTTFPAVAVEPGSQATANYWCSHGKPRAKEAKSRVQRNR